MYMYVCVYIYIYSTKTGRQSDSPVARATLRSSTATYAWFQAGCHQRVRPPPHSDSERARQ